MCKTSEKPDEPDWARRERLRDLDWIRENLHMFWQVAAEVFVLVLLKSEERTSTYRVQPRQCNGSGCKMNSLDREWLILDMLELQWRCAGCI